ncbi:kinase-like protein [Macroventuria anomochaeta]|uniref:Kinase-like protein n=1 Tax=Macroventuria anomochaeta TaxID=301207 RepID=A0ACB6SBJ1_9PLEO|nr:kinase-like protein [Macroventuria anomochaeta]KAF2631665.1 kinase-like protein [Macroventuria anomochaeta]
MPLVEDFPRNYRFIKNLGKGGEGQVQEFAQKRTGTLVAVKVIKRRRGGRPREVGFLSKLPENDYIIRYLGYFDGWPDWDYYTIVLEHCPGGDLYQFYKKCTASNDQAVFSEAFMWTVFSQVAKALAFIHEGVGCRNPRDAEKWRSLIHCDIRLENILIKSLGTNSTYSSIVIKLADFGLAGYYDPRATGPNHLGTPAYWAPELDWERLLYTPANDVWAIGAVMHHLAHGFLPIEDPWTTIKRWEKWNAGQPYPSNWPIKNEESWWCAYAKREVVPINLEPGSHTEDWRRKRPTPKYSNALNDCLSLALKIHAYDRPEAGKLARHIESTRTDVLVKARAGQATNDSENMELVTGRGISTFRGHPKGDGLRQRMT